MGVVFDEVEANVQTEQPASATEPGESDSEARNEKPCDCIKQAEQRAARLRAD